METLDRNKSDELTVENAVWIFRHLFVEGLDLNSKRRLMAKTAFDFIKDFGVLEVNKEIREGVVDWYRSIFAKEVVFEPALAILALRQMSIAADISGYYPTDEAKEMTRAMFAEVQ
jgi:hypothetical protein